ncbi:MAG: glucokinase [Janthinobacterium lividum]
MTEIVTTDIGGTNARFALATITDGTVADLGESTTFRTSDYASLQRAWAAFGERLGRPLPPAIAISFAGPVHGDVLKLTNNPWVIRTSAIAASLGVEQWTLVNDFGAVGHAVAHVDEKYLQHVCGPDTPLPPTGVISIVGPGTGLGVAQVLRDENGYRVVETEGGHVDFAPVDALEDRMVVDLRARFRRVSTERIVSGPGLLNIYNVLRQIEGEGRSYYEEKPLWLAALAAGDKLAVAALERFCLSLGSVAGDIALAQGASGLVVAGGIGPRLAGILPASGFSYRFTAKGRFETFMGDIPVKVLTHPQPGLLGAAAAFAVQHPG